MEVGKSEYSPRMPFESMTASQNGSLERSDKKADIRKKLMMMEAAMPAVLAWNMFQMCQSDNISPAAAARKIFQTEVPSSHEYDEGLDESTMAVLQKLDDLIHYQRKLRIEFERAEELASFRDKHLRRKVAELEAKAARNRKLFDDMITSLRLPGCELASDASVDSIASQDLVLFEEMQRLAENEVVLKRKIDELEKKEKMYLQTLEKADQLWMVLKSRT